MQMQTQHTVPHTVPHAVPHTEIINIIKKCCIEISTLIRHTDVETLGSLTNQSNKSDDDVKKLDVISNNILKEHLMQCGSVRAFASEEDPDMYYTEFKDAPYLVCFDPLDGSSNIDVNITVGTIFAIYKYDEDGNISSGRDIVCAGYGLYGGSTEFVIANEGGVELYTLFEQDFLLTHPNLVIPHTGKIYSINESNRGRWLDDSYDRAVKSFIDNGYTTRWVGSLVADAHRTLLKGGYFSYPVNSKLPTGRLRVLYEALPFAYIFYKAGGCSSDGNLDCLLDLEFPDNIHKKCGLVLASPDEFNVWMSFRH